MIAIDPQGKRGDGTNAASRIVKSRTYATVPVMFVTVPAIGIAATAATGRWLPHTAWQSVPPALTVTTSYRRARARQPTRERQHMRRSAIANDHQRGAVHVEESGQESSG
jgi:hypothetical protein